MFLIISIDGPSASGKSTVSRRVAEKLGFLHVDSGSFYRGITFFLLQAGVSPADPAASVAALQRLEMRFSVKANSVVFSIGKTYPDAELRTQSVNENVSRVAALPAVRDWVTQRLRKLPDLGSLVMEGRDIGTAVFPEAKFKFYLDATPEERARRRHLELENAGVKTECADILRSILKRDGIDSSRAVDPLKIAPDAVVIQTTQMRIDEVVDLIVEKVHG